MRIFSMVVAAFSLVTAGIVTPTSVAQAAGTRKFHGSACLVKSGTATFNSAGQIGNATSGEVVLWCPLTIDPNVDLPTVNASVRVSGFSNGCIGQQKGLSALTCVIPAAGGAPLCNLNEVSPPTCTPGVVELEPGAAFPNPNDSVVLQVRLRGVIGGSSNTFFGYRLITP
jgi:hypothetical protein